MWIPLIYDICLLSWISIASTYQLDALMHNWANPRKFENELGVPSDRQYA